MDTPEKKNSAVETLLEIMEAVPVPLACIAVGLVVLMGVVFFFASYILQL